MLNRTPQRLAASLAYSFALFTASPVHAQAPAKLALADTAVYIHIDKPADWFAQYTQGPFGEQMRKDLINNDGSGDLLAALGMNVDQFMAAYFGDEVVVLSPEPEADGIIFTKVGQNDRERAIDSLALQRVADIAGQPTYSGEDGEGVIVLADDWVAMCGMTSVDYLRKILSQPADAPRLGDTPAFQKWIGELPADRTMTLYAVEAEADAEHALGVVRNDRGLDATYLTNSQEIDLAMRVLGETQTIGYGSLPANTIGAIAFNMFINDEDKAGYAALDPLLGGKSFVKDVLPKLQTPTVMFMASVDGAEVTPPVGVEVPVIGMSVRMNDDSVAQDLTNMMNGVVLLMNFGVAEFNAGPIPQRAAEYNGVSYRVAELGTPVATGLQFSELKPIQIVYGQVGSDFIVCTQEVFFKRCIDASDADKSERIQEEGTAHRLAKTPVLAMTARPDGFAQMMLSWANMLEEKGLPEALADEQQEPIDTKALKDVASVIQQFSGMKIQIWRGEDGVTIGRAQILTPQ